MSTAPVLKKRNLGYSFWGEWAGNSSALLGCISLKENSKCLSEDDQVMRLIIIKPHLDLNDLLTFTFVGDAVTEAGEDPDNPPNEVGWDCNGPRRISQCVVNNKLYEAWREDPVSCTDHPAACMSKVPCEVAYYYARSGIDINQSPNFPQSSTVFVTANSSGTIFASYRELARLTTYLSRSAISAALEPDTTNWRELLLAQIKKPIVRRSLSEKFVWPKSVCERDDLGAANLIMRNSVTVDAQP